MAVINVAYFEKLSITTMIVARMSDFGKELMKFMVALSHGNYASGSGSSNPPGGLWSTLSCGNTK